MNNATKFNVNGHTFRRLNLIKDDTRVTECRSITV